MSSFLELFSTIYVRRYTYHNQMDPLWLIYEMLEQYLTHFLVLESLSYQH